MSHASVREAPREGASASEGTAPGAAPPFDAARLAFDAVRLDGLLEEAGIDVLLVTSKHNLQYMLGGYRFFFFDHQDAIGRSRYLPVLVYSRGDPARTAYFGNSLENFERENRAFQVPDFRAVRAGTAAPAQAAIEHVRSLGLPRPRIGVEAGFLPLDAGDALRGAFPEGRLIDAVVPLERLRARKTAEELALLREATERVEESMLAVFAAHGPGTTKRALVDALRREEVARGLVFEYCLITAGTSLNRAPSDQVWGAGEPLSLDSGGTYRGYIGDICRMAVAGEPDAELRDLLAEVDAIQHAAMRAIRAGAMGGEVYAAAGRALSEAGQREHIGFVAHGVGLISHEVPHLTSKGPEPYPDDDARRPLETGMVLSIETTMRHPRRGFIKLEDTVAVQPDGAELFGARGRGWNRAAG